MTLRITQGNLFESDAQTLVNTVNTIGVMGKGIALGFKQRFPDMFEDYRIRCERNEVHLGEPYLFRRIIPPMVINFPTKGHWRAPSRLADIERGLAYLVAHVQEWGVESLAVPPLGCGNGELEWRVVGPIIYEHLGELAIPVEMYAPFGTPLVQLEPDFLVGQLELVHAQDGPAEFKVPPAMAALVAVLDQLERNPLGPRIGRIAFQKLAYFATEAGLPTGLRFDRGAYGPFSGDLKPAEARLLNNSLLEPQAHGNMIHMRVGPAFARAQGNFAEDFRAWRPVIDRLVDLFSRMSTRDAEVAASVHFAAKELREKQAKVTERDVFEYVDQWKPARFSRDNVALAIRNLGMLGWLELSPSRTLPLPEQVL